MVVTSSPSFILFTNFEYYIFATLQLQEEYPQLLNVIVVANCDADALGPYIHISNKLVIFLVRFTLQYNGCPPQERIIPCLYLVHLALKNKN